MEGERKEKRKIKEDKRGRVKKIEETVEREEGRWNTAMGGGRKGKRRGVREEGSRKERKKTSEWRGKG